MRPIVERTATVIGVECCCDRRHRSCRRAGAGCARSSGLHAPRPSPVLPARPPSQRPPRPRSRRDRRAGHFRGRHCGVVSRLGRNSGGSGLGRAHMELRPPGPRVEPSATISRQAVAGSDHRRAASAPQLDRCTASVRPRVPLLRGACRHALREPLSLRRQRTGGTSIPSRQPNGCGRMRAACGDCVGWSW